MTFLHHSTAIKDVSEGVSFPELSHAFRAVHRAEANAHFEAAGREAMSKTTPITAAMLIPLPLELTL
eukprot:17708-Heterococcus_DN1.PRE.1